MYKVLCFIFYLVYIINCIFANNTVNSKPSLEFSKPILIKLKIYYEKDKQIYPTINGKIYGEYVTVHYYLDNKHYMLILELNKNLLAKGYFHRYQKNGKRIIKKPPYRIKYCHYQGKIRGIQNSWVAVSTCENFLKGVIFDGSELFYIQKIDSDNENDDNFYVYKHSDLIEDRRMISNFETTIHKYSYNYKQHSIKKPNGIPYISNTLSRYIELILVVDNMEYNHLDKNLGNVYQLCKDITNIVNGLFSEMNIFIALTGVVVWTEGDEIELSSNSSVVLNNFVNYRQESLLPDHPNDYAHLLTKYKFDDFLGNTYTGQICTFNASGGMSMIHSEVNSLVATTVALEIANNLAMSIACTMMSNNPHLQPISLINGTVCGNGFVEPGEECDCGLPDICDNTCCNATTCMLYSNASCATGECCDLMTCHLKNASTMCRTARSECDLPEYCNGESEYCPSDVYKIDMEICNSGKDFCYKGFCKTHSDQCKFLWGNTGVSSEFSCYEYNLRGDEYGNCGYDYVNQSYIKCDKENILCGTLKCDQSNEDNNSYGYKLNATIDWVIQNSTDTWSLTNCQSIIFDLRNDVNNLVSLGLVPDGATCGKGKICLNQKCVSVENLRAKTNRCPQDCNGNGFCDNLGHCHCKLGFSLPFCDDQELSFSILPKKIVTGLFILLGMIPFVTAIIFMIYYNNKHKHTSDVPWLKLESE